MFLLESEMRSRTSWGTPRGVWDLSYPSGLNTYRLPVGRATAAEQKLLGLLDADLGFMSGPRNPKGAGLRFGVGSLVLGCSSMAIRVDITWIIIKFNKLECLP